MNLKDFQKHIDPTILERGRKYFNDNHVVDLEEVDDVFWCGYVMGSEQYVVEVMVDRFKITECACDCPDVNVVCKHIVAVLFSISEIKGLLKSSCRNAKTERLTKLSIKKLIDKISEKELKDFVQHYSKKNRAFKSDFEIYFAEKNDNFDIQKQVSSQIKAAIKKFMKWNFIDFRSSNSLARELSNILKQAEQYLSKGNLLDACKFVQTFLEETLPTLNYSDDSNGLLSDVIDQAVEFYVDIAYKSPIPLKENIADYLKGAMSNSLYFDNGNYGLSLTELYKNLCVELNREEEFISAAEGMIQYAEINQRYDYEYLLSILIDFLSEIERVEDARELINKNIHLSSIRTKLINEYIEERGFDNAKKLVEEGILLSEKKNHSGEVLEWKKFLLKIAELQGDTKTVREYLENFAFKTSFNKYYYQKWKDTYKKEDWELVIEKKIKTIHDAVIKDQKSMQMPDYVMLYLLGPIYVEEEMYDRLINLVVKQNDLQTILHYHPDLHLLYPAELMNLYVPLLNEQADTASDRNGYNRLFQVVDVIYKDIPEGRNALKEIVLKWKIFYKRRPAMLDVIENFLLKVS